MRVAELFASMTYGPAPESAAPALEWIARHQPSTRLFIGGSWSDPFAGERFDVVNPANGRHLIDSSQADTNDIDRAVAAARTAFPAWSDLTCHTRARYLYALARQIQKHSRLFAVLESLDNGKPIRESRDLDIPLVARHFSYHAGWAQLRDQEFPGYGPIGVVGQIIPWNFPLLMLAWKVAPALAAGNTVILKPAEFTPLTAILFAEICQEVGLPAGVLNVVTGDGRTGELLVRHPDVDKIAFTGSTEVGRLIRVATSGTRKRLSLELGGKSPFVVFADADLDSVVEGIVDAIWFNQGQVCCAGSRLLVEESIAERLYVKIRARMERLRLGDPLDKAVDMGAIIAPAQLTKVRSLVDQGIAEGATIWQPSWACPTEGYWYPPTLFTDVGPANTIAQTEIFGPVLVAMTFRTPDEAVALANNTPYGLAASVWSTNIAVALDLARRIRAGTIWINSTNLFDAASGFGGYQESGFGREGGREGMWEYLGKREETGVKSEGSDQRLAISDQQDGTHHLTPSPAPTDEGEYVSHQPSAPGLQPSFHSSLVTLHASVPPIDRTPKLFIGGKQTRPDSGYSRAILGPSGVLIGEVGDGNRKDIRNAVEAARGATGWSDATAHNRAQVIYYLAENLAIRSDEFSARIDHQTGIGLARARHEVERSLELLFEAAAWSDKFGGTVQSTPIRGLTVAVHEPIGVIGIVCPESPPLLGLIALVAPALALGNRVVVVPSEHRPLSATDLYQIAETSDVPPGVLNIVTGESDPLAAVLADHDDVDSIWYFANGDRARVERGSAGNLKRTWIGGRDWWRDGIDDEIRRESVQVKNIWVPYGA